MCELENVQSTHDGLSWHEHFTPVLASLLQASLNHPPTSGDHSAITSIEQMRNQEQQVSHRQRRDCMTVTDSERL